MRHAPASTTLKTYGHLWPGAAESTRSTIGAVVAVRMDSSANTAYGLRTVRVTRHSRARTSFQEFAPLAALTALGIRS